MVDHPILYKIHALTLLLFLDFINTLAVTIFGVQHRFNDGYVYGPAFWVTVCSTIISVLTNILLITDYIHTPQFSQSGAYSDPGLKSLTAVPFASR